MPTKNDAIFTVGGVFTDHQGNILDKWRGMCNDISIPPGVDIKRHRAKYSMAMIEEEVENRGGRFLLERPQGGWDVMDKDEACAKISDALGGEDDEDLNP